MTEPKIPIRLERNPPSWYSVSYAPDTASGWLLIGDVPVLQVRLPAEHWSALGSALTENAGLREALEASEAECAKAIEERDEAQSSLDTVSHNFDVFVNLYDAASAQRDAMRSVVEAAVAWRVSALHVVEAAAALPDDAPAVRVLRDHRAAMDAVIAAVDSYTQSSNPGETS